MKVNCSIALALIAGALTTPAMAKTNSTVAQRWLAAAPPVPEFKIPTSRAAWERQRKQVRAQLWKLLGDLPPRPKKLAVETLKREDCGDYFREKFQFDNGAGAVVPGYLLIPKKLSGKAPAILYCHWHGGQYDIGKEELFGTNATPVGAGPELARRGYVVIAIDAYCFGERNGQGPGGASERGSAGEMTASKFNLWFGRTLWGMIIRDDLLALDYLCSRPEVDAQRIGVTGISMGATRTWWAMALDERLKAGVAVCCLTRYQNLIEHEALKAHGIYYFVPGLLQHFDTEAVVALAAPRPLLFLSGENDGGSPVDGIRIIEKKVKQAYQLYDAGKEFESIVYPGVGHQYTPDMWQRMMVRMDSALMKP
ncbi:MAG: dienelactone hydrolase [Pedosphaera sp.]|nr:dienelactone hydrolase [Pedosphaera sp.]